MLGMLQSCMQQNSEVVYKRSMQVISMAAVSGAF